MAAATAESKYATLFTPSALPPRTAAQTAALTATQAWRDARVARLSESAQDTMEAVYLSDRTLVRYLVSFDWNVAKTTKALDASCVYRRGVVTPDMHCTACASVDSTHALVRVGYDNWRRPIIYLCPARCRDLKPEFFLRHVLAEMEEAFADDDVDPAVRSDWVWITDLRAASLLGVGLSMGRALTDVFTNHCPERLGVMIILDPPTVVQWAWDALKPFMDPATVKRMVTLRAAGDIRAAMNALADAPTAAWLIDAIVNTQPKPGMMPDLPPSSPVPFHRRVQRGERLRMSIPAHVRTAERATRVASPAAAAPAVPAQPEPAFTTAQTVDAALATVVKPLPALDVHVSSAAAATAPPPLLSPTSAHKRTSSGAPTHSIVRMLIPMWK